MPLANFIITRVSPIYPTVQGLPLTEPLIAGIGTYDINEKSVDKSWLGQLNSSISMTIDQGVGSTFDAHVMAGYRFLMKFYDTVSQYDGLCQIMLY